MAGPSMGRRAFKFVMAGLKFEMNGFMFNMNGSIGWDEPLLIRDEVPRIQQDGDHVPG
jgi:hypothetical protein